MSAIQRRLQELAQRAVDSGREVGLQIAVYRHGLLLADVAAGIADTDTGRPVRADTPFCATSAGKGILATVVHVLAERGAFDYGTPLAAHWPEFAANGKGAVTIGQVLAHSAGLPAAPPNTTVERRRDREWLCRVPAEPKPRWEPGTRIGYHPQSFEYLVGEFVRRVTGSTISQVLAEEVAGPLGVAAELYCAVPVSELPRTARLVAAEGNLEQPADSPFFAMAPKAVQPMAEFGNRPEVLTGHGTGGAMSARAVARMYAALMDEVDGVRLVSSRRLEQITAPAAHGVGEIMGVPAVRALGYELGLPLRDGPPRLTCFGMAGSGGTAAYADTAHRTVVAVTKNLVTLGRFDVFGQVNSLVGSRITG